MQVEPFLPPEHFVGLRLDGAVAPSFCDELRGELARRGFAATGARYPRGYRDNDRLVFDDAQLAARLFAELAEALPAELSRDGARWRLCGFNERFRACRYRDGQAFCVHRDGPCTPDEETRSWLTVQLYLDDAEGMSGGRTRFYADREGKEPWAAIRPRRGTVIAFDHRAWHDGEAVTGGEKHVLRTDALYRRLPGAVAGAAAAPAVRAPDESRRPLDARRAGTGTGTPPSAGARPEARVLGRHRGYAWRVVACRDGSIVSSGRDGTVRRWRAGRELARHQLAASSVTALVEDGGGRLWWGTRGGALGWIDRGGAIGPLDRGGEGGDGGEAGGAAITCVAEGLGAALAAVVTPAGGVAFATSHGEVIEVDRAGALARRRAHAGWAWALAVRGAALLSAGEDGDVIEHLGGRRRVLASLGQPVRALAALGDGAVLAGCDDGMIYALRGSRRELVRAHGAAVTSLAIAPDGVGWASGSEDGEVKQWRGGALAATSPRRADFITCVAFTGGGSLVSAGYDGALVEEVSPHAIAGLPSASSPVIHAHGADREAPVRVGGWNCVDFACGRDG